MSSETKIILGMVTLGVVIFYAGEVKKKRIEKSIAPSSFIEEESSISKLHSLQYDLGIKPDKLKKKEKKQWYKYRVEIETIPENQIYKIEKSEYQQSEVSRLGETYSYKVYEFYSDKIMTTQEASDFVKNHPEKCTLVSNYPQDNIYDKYNREYEDYHDDPEDEVNYDPEIFDFLVD